jgi:hypothetical protein
VTLRDMCHACQRWDSSLACHFSTDLNARKKIAFYTCVPGTFFLKV